MTAQTVGFVGLAVILLGALCLPAFVLENDWRTRLSAIGIVLGVTTVTVAALIFFALLASGWTP